MSDTYNPYMRCSRQLTNKYDKIISELVMDGAEQDDEIVVLLYIDSDGQELCHVD